LVLSSASLGMLLASSNPRKYSENFIAGKWNFVKSLVCTSKKNNENSVRKILALLNTSGDT